VLEPLCERTREHLAGAGRASTTIELENCSDLPSPTFDLSGVQGLSKKAIDLHLGLYKAYVEQLNKLLEQSPQRSAGAAQLALDGYNRRFAFELQRRGAARTVLRAAGRQAPPAAFRQRLREALHQDFGDFSGWKASVETLAKTRGVARPETRGSSRGRIASPGDREALAAVRVVAKHGHARRGMAEVCQQRAAGTGWRRR